MSRRKAAPPPPPPLPARAPVWQRLLGALPALALGTALLGWAQGWWAPPTRHDPFAPLQLADPPNWTTRYKLQRLAHAPVACRAALAQSDAFATTPVADRGEPGEQACGWQDAVRVASGRVALSSAVTLSCPAAVSLALWERHTLQPAAERHAGARLARIEHAGSYACRNVNHAATGRLSEHARANALDVTAFGFAGGGRAAVLRDWSAAQDNGFTPQAHFLLDAHDGACRFFHAVLGPPYNAAHRDHFHLDMGRWGACR